MSGGSFNYAFGTVSQFADELDVRIDTNNTENERGYMPGYSAETIAALKEIEYYARFTSDLMKEAEWLYSGNIGEETFINRVLEIKRKYEHC